MAQKRVVVNTSAGTFLLVPNMQVAIADKEIKFAFASELSKHLRPSSPNSTAPPLRILLEKTVAEELTLERHIIPTLWYKSRMYRADRELLFADGDATNPPKTTLLSKKLKEIGHVEDETQIGPMAREFTEKLNNANFGYSDQGVRKWFDHVIMPNKPQALYSISKELGDWATGEEVTLAARRLKTIHSGTRAQLARPNSESAAKRNDKPISENGGIVTRGHVSLAESIRMLRNVYGEGVFQKIVTPVDVTSCSTIDVQPSGQASSGSQPTEISRSFIGFPMGNFDKRASVLAVYGGTDRSREIEDALKARYALLVNSTNFGASFIPKFVEKVLESERAQAAAGRNLKVRINNVVHTANLKITKDVNAIVLQAKTFLIYSLLQAGWTESDKNRIREKIQSQYLYDMEVAFGGKTFTDERIRAAIDNPERFVESKPFNIALKPFINAFQSYGELSVSWQEFAATMIVNAAPHIKDGIQHRLEIFENLMKKAPDVKPYDMKKHFIMAMDGEVKAGLAVFEYLWDQSTQLRNDLAKINREALLPPSLLWMQLTGPELEDPFGTIRKIKDHYGIENVYSPIQEIKRRMDEPLNKTSIAKPSPLFVNTYIQ